MQLFAELITRLDQTNKTGEKIAALADYLGAAPEEDRLWAIALFTGRRPRRSIRSSLLRAWAAEMAGLPPWLLEESYHVVGDLAETLSLLLPPPDEGREARSLAGWMEFLDRIAPLSDEAKGEQVRAAWAQMEARERFVFNKLITGGFRLGVSQQLLVKALAQQSGLPETSVAHRLTGNWTPASTSYQRLLSQDASGEDLAKPYPFFLAYPLEAPPESLGAPQDWLAEWKWDGIRSQMIRRRGQWSLWSRGEELISEKFPELAALAERLPPGTVLDAELLPFRKERPLPFQVLQTRIGRKNLSRKILEEAPVLLMAYDLLEWEGKDIREQPLAARRDLLSALVQEAGLPHLLRLSPEAPFESWEALAALRSGARAHLAEGLMIKRLASSYQTGRRRGDWWKWKVDAYSVDAVMVYAQRGHGRRANLYTDYTFAVWQEGALLPFAKAYSGLSDEEIREVDAWVKRNTQDRFGPVRAVKPELVFEIGFEGISRSSRHKSGVALRFPRILRWRQDKPAAEADSLDRLMALLDA
jgi:DNA ligase-1